MGLSRVGWVGWVGMVGLFGAGWVHWFGRLPLVCHSICSTSSRAVTRLTVYRASQVDDFGAIKNEIPDLAQIELAHTQNLSSLTTT